MKIKNESTGGAVFMNLITLCEKRGWNEYNDYDTVESFEKKVIKIVGNRYKKDANDTW